MNFSRTSRHIKIMICILGSAIILASLSSCIGAANPSETAKNYRFGNPVENEADAQIAASSALKASFNYGGPLTVIKVGKMSYAEYSHLVAQPLNQPADLKVWLVVYLNDTWQSKPSTVKTTPYPPFQGCVYVAINADDGSPVEAGGPLNKGILAECDN